MSVRKTTDEFLQGVAFALGTVAATFGGPERVFQDAYSTMHKLGCTVDVMEAAGADDYDITQIKRAAGSDLLAQLSAEDNPKS